MYSVVLSGRYKTALKRLSRHKDFKGDVLAAIIKTLARGEQLETKYRDHQLTGKFKENRECHLQHDMLLMYRKYEDVLLLLLIDIGTHDDLFR
jgi:mRNA interferase YafQ